MNEWLERMEFATQEVFESVLRVRMGRWSTGNGDGASDLTAVISLAGSPSGVFKIGCSSASAAHLAMRMLGSGTPESEENAKDALGEVCNMIAGTIKSRLSRSEDLGKISVPTVISGHDYQVRTLFHGEKYELRLNYEGQPVSISIEIQQPS
ncbi:MAG: chemotaxis protein CheX [Terriglobia bacterium]